MSDDIKLNLNVPYSTSNNDAFTFSGDGKSSYGGMDIDAELEDAKKKMESVGADKVPPKPKPLKYPYHQENRYPCCINFSIVSQEGAIIEGIPQLLGSVKRAFDAFTQGWNMDSDQKTALEQETLKDTSDPDPNADPNKGKGRGYSRTPINKGVKIYLTPGFATNDALTYSNVDMGITGAAALDVFNNGEGFTKAISTMIQQGFGSLSDTTGNGADLAQLTVSRNAQGILGKVIPDELSNSLKMSSAVTVNPNTRAMFKGVALRTFQFQFKFLPVSEAEAKEVEAIIKRFREHAYPESIPSGNVSAGYKYPHLFDIELLAYGKPIGTKIKTCVLESISTSYNASSMAWHPSPGEEKSYASEYDLTLSFREEAALDASDIRDGGY